MGIIHRIDSCVGSCGIIAILAVLMVVGCLVNPANWLPIIGGIVIAIIVFALMSMGEKPYRPTPTTSAAPLAPLDDRVIEVR
jgi:hypothetical protein